jgi:hypothetical protein
MTGEHILTGRPRRHEDFATALGSRMRSQTKWGASLLPTPSLA